MNTKRLCLVTALFLSGVYLAEAQQTPKIPRIAYLSGSGVNGASRAVEAFRHGLRDVGYLEGQNIIVEYRYAEGKLDRIPRLVTELVQLKPDVIVSSNFNALRAAKEATTTIPIIMVTTQDPVATGLVDSLARPGSNVTGITRLTTELGEKRLELLKEIVPIVARVGVLLSDNRTQGTDLHEFESAAQTLKLELQPLVVRGPTPDLKGAFQAARKWRANGLMTGRGPVLNNYRKQIAELAVHHRLPLMSEGHDYADVGALVSYSANETESFRRAALYVDKILKGAKPTELPIEQPTKFELVINLKTAKQIGLAIPPNVLARADRIIK
jgi:putative ABC transport system substrate-binding protein